MGWIATSIQYLPYLICSGVLGGIAVAGYRRTQATGLLLIAIACGVRVLHECVGIYSMWRIVSGGHGYSSYMTIYGAVQMAGGITTEVLFIVGVALLIRRVAPAHADVARNASPPPAA